MSPTRASTRAGRSTGWPCAPGCRLSRREPCPSGGTETRAPAARRGSRPPRPPPPRGAAPERAPPKTETDCGLGCSKAVAARLRTASRAASCSRDTVTGADRGARAERAVPRAGDGRRRQPAGQRRGARRYGRRRFPVQLEHSSYRSTSGASGSRLTRHQRQQVAALQRLEPGALKTETSDSSPTCYDPPCPLTHVATSPPTRGRRPASWPSSPRATTPRGSPEKLSPISAASR